MDTKSPGEEQVWPWKAQGKTWVAKWEVRGKGSMVEGVASNAPKNQLEWKSVCRRDEMDLTKEGQVV